MGMRREGGGGVGRGMLKERKQWPQSTDKRITSNRDRGEFSFETRKPVKEQILSWTF